MNFGFRKTRPKSLPVGPSVHDSRSGTGSSPINCPRNVALARSSTSANPLRDWIGIASSASRR